ncbi:hypothetical protein ACN59_06395, partial [Escherichia coli]
MFKCNCTLIVGGIMKNALQFLFV